MDSLFILFFIGFFAYFIFRIYKTITIKDKKEYEEKRDQLIDDLKDIDLD